MELCELFLDGSAEDIEAARDRGQNLGTNYVRPEIVLTEDDIYGRLV
jgi:hypothetical protein